jgi:hypothetical protein
MASRRETLIVDGYKPYLDLGLREHLALERGGIVDPCLLKNEPLHDMQLAEELLCHGFR